MPFVKESLMTPKYEHTFDYPMDQVKITGRFRSDKGSLDDLMASITSHGLQQPIGVTVTGKLIWGERRYMAHKELELPTIRAYIVSGADETTLLTMEHDENVSRLQFRWSDQVKLTDAIFRAKSNNMLQQGRRWTQGDHAKASGMSQQTISRQLKLAEAFKTLPDLADMPTQDDAMKEYSRLEEKAIDMHLRKKTPDAIRNAPHWAREHYVVGDSLDGMSQMANASFDFAEVDPPYAIEIDRRKSRNLDDGHVEDYHEIGKEAFPPFMQAVISHTHRLLKQDTFAVFWYGMQWHTQMLAWLRQGGFIVNPMPAIWYKGAVGQTAQPDVALGSSYEPFWLVRKGTPKMKRQGRSNVFHYDSVSPAKKIHITEKPIELLSDILDTILFPGSNVLVPFLGSGVTLRAAYRLGHTGLGFDRSPEHKARFLELVTREHPTPDPEAGDA